MLSRQHAFFFLVVLKSSSFKFTPSPQHHRSPINSRRTNFCAISQCIISFYWLPNTLQYLSQSRHREVNDIDSSAYIRPLIAISFNQPLQLVYTRLKFTESFTCGEK